MLPQLQTVPSSLRGDNKSFATSDVNLRGSYSYLQLIVGEFKALQNSSGITQKPDNEETGNGNTAPSFVFKFDSFSYSNKLLSQAGFESVAQIMSSQAFMDTTGPSNADFNIIVMPFPSWHSLINTSLTPNASNSDQVYTGKIDPYQDDSENSNYYYGEHFEYPNAKPALLQELYNRETKVYHEWGMPADANAEQFYIAMRWPYEPVWFDSKEIKNAFTNQYKDSLYGLRPPQAAEDDTSKWYLYGKPQDYKNRKVLVYSPATNTAVCCKPAYFLWGNQRDQIFYDSGKIKSDDPNDIAYGENAQANPFIDAVVSPDAAYYLGILNNNSMFSENNNYNANQYTFGTEYLAGNLDSTYNDFRRYCKLLRWLYCNATRI